MNKDVLHGSVVAKGLTIKCKRLPASLEIMDEEKKRYSLKKLNSRSYKNLQRIAKSMNLPSNVKKTHLIRIIHAKEYKSEKELNEIIYNVKLEKRQKSGSKQAKNTEKTDIQTSEVSSTSNRSPPITETPKPQKSILKPNSCKLNSTHPKNVKTYSANVRPATSDRVLRSSRDRPNYRTISMGNVFDLMEPDFTPAKVSKKSEETNNPMVNTSSDDNLLTPVGKPETSGIRPVSTNEAGGVNKRERKISGISRLITPEKTHQTYTKTMNFIHQNGKVTRLKAFIERPTPLINRNFSETSNPGLNTRHGANVIVRLLRETVMQNQNNTRLVPFGNYQGNNENNTYSVDLIMDRSQNLPSQSLPDPYRGYSGVKETCNQISQVQNSDSEVLQQINSEFISSNSECNERTPVYEQVPENSEKTQPPICTTIESVPNSGFLENLYNFKSQYITSSAPLQSIKTTTNTTCVYSTPMVITAILQQPPASVTDECNACDLFMLDNQCATTEYELVTDDEQNAPSRNVYVYDKVVDMSTSLETVSNEDVLANTTIPQLVEDAMDLISQDKEYMERVAMHMCMQCFFCPWAGSKYLLENHLRQEHIRDIETYETEDWVTTFTLGSLVQREVWLCRVIQHGSMLYVISAKYEDPDIFMASVNCITTDGENITKLAKITVFNKVSGEPYSWEGLVLELPHTMPYYKDTDCLKLELSKMNLLPNSANLKLINRELVVDSPMKVVIGQPALHDIHINIFIKLSDITPL